MIRWLLALALLFAANPGMAQVPRMQALPLPNDEISLQRDGVEIARYHHGSHHRRPFVYPMIGPSGRSLTRMGHPQDPFGHSHHNSIWISHHDIGGTDFWADRGGKSLGKIVHQRVEKLFDEDQYCGVQALHHWIADANQKILLIERRRVGIHPLEKGEWLMTLDLALDVKEPTQIGKTPFGLVGVRMAKSIGVLDGGGTIRNSAGGVNEKEVFWKPAKWVDYSGKITREASEGITLFDHPKNPNHPTVYHVRNDGWMGASLTFDAPRELKPGETLRLRYGLYVHAGLPSLESLDSRWTDFAKMAVPDLTAKMK